MEMEATLKRLLEEIEATKRRVNVLSSSNPRDEGGADFHTAQT